MTANVDQIFPVTPNVGGIGTAVTTAANTAFDGTGTVITAYTAGTNGSAPKGLRFLPQGGAGNNNVATVARIFVNNGSTQSTATNNLFIGEVSLPSTTGSATAALSPVEFPFPPGFALPNGYKINWCLGTAVATGYWAVCYGGDF
jgi:hypothetical protein